MKKRKYKRAVELPLAVGECWFVKLPKALQVVCVFIEEMTTQTIVLRLEADVGTGSTHAGVVGRYERRDVRFVEKLQC